MGLRDIGASLPPGFRFYPSDEELVCHYLQKKIGNEDISQGTLVEIDLHTCEPWQLPEVAKLNSSDWYFFSFRDRKYATGFRTNRATISGYWKATGKDRTVVDSRTNSIVGMRKTLVFYKNRAPNGVKTGWIMHEFRQENPHIPPKEEWVLCRIFHKSKTENNIELSPQNVFDEKVTAGGGDTSPEAVQIIRPPAAAGYNSKNHQIINSFMQTPPAHHHQIINPNHLQNLPPLNPSNLQISHHHQFHMTNRVTTRKRSRSYDGVFEDYDELMINSKCPDEEDDYGFLLDHMNFEESNLGEGMSCSNMEDIKFEDDNGMIIF